MNQAETEKESNAIALHPLFLGWLRLWLCSLLPVSAMRVLVACEFSGRVRRAFRSAGHNVTSVDYLPAEDGANYETAGSLGFHYTGDVLKFLGYVRGYDEFDLMIAHPPCTYLALSGNRWRAGREVEVSKALAFAKALWELTIPRIALEQPRSILSSHIGTRTQEIHPYEFGIPEFKTTWLWLKNLPPLRSTAIIDPPEIGTKEHDRWSRVHRAAPGPERWKERSRTYPEIAQAMAAQWGCLPANQVAEDKA